MVRWFCEFLARWWPQFCAHFLGTKPGPASGTRTVWVHRCGPLFMPGIWAAFWGQKKAGFWCHDEGQLMFWAAPQRVARYMSSDKSFRQACRPRLPASVYPFGRCDLQPGLRQVGGLRFVVFFALAMEMCMTVCLGCSGSCGASPIRFGTKPSCASPCPFLFTSLPSNINSIRPSAALVRG